MVPPQVVLCSFHTCVLDLSYNTDAASEGKYALLLICFVHKRFSHDARGIHTSIPVVQSFFFSSSMKRNYHHIVDLRRVLRWGFSSTVIRLMCP